MSIPKIAISNEDDAGLQILEERPSRKNTTSTPPSSPFKSIIKHHHSQSATPSSASTTTYSYFTCQTRPDSNYSNETLPASIRRKRSPDQAISQQQKPIDENDTENDVSELSHCEPSTKTNLSQLDTKLQRRRGTISTSSVLPSKDPNHNYFQTRQYSLRQNRSLASTNNDSSSATISRNSSRNYFIPHVSTPPPPLPYAEKNARDSLTQVSNEIRGRKLNSVRRTNSYRPSSNSSSTTLRRFIVRDGKLIEKTVSSTHPVIKRRSTLDNSSYRIIQMESSSVYETAKTDEQDLYSETNSNVGSIRLIPDANASMQLIGNEQSDMQLESNNIQMTTNEQQANVIHRKIDVFDKDIHELIFFFSDRSILFGTSVR